MEESDESLNRKLTAERVFHLPEIVIGAAVALG